MFVFLKFKLEIRGGERESEQGEFIYGYITSNAYDFSLFFLLYQMPHVDPGEATKINQVKPWVFSLKK